ncbi:hypothetical protein TPB0596_34520 [Tsukamurella pulmonis]|uniref:Uncharacterized protein n=3 Tax=Tsukamurella pulmonis TaxID=47312 RepID=A0A1H1CZE1_9ACTN|nr:hypothetical protein AXK56_05800 [Tsukamurella pulmonis]KXP10934.1 hypothetical protein AXK57_06040 [Tsukamurella pulmonis]BDD83689.1 hypothetical protein TPB0596_34520 [Tsukamurella pulmonis]SDQ69584.1 hypothetical protein SAMN04489765_1461 [Tsukamurella pulmonis]SUP22755.1 Uncharacterised protein [Tsukamurella pulmonis]
MGEDSGRMSADEARRTLEAADAASIATPADRERLEKGLIRIGVLVGLLIVALRLTIGNPDAPLWLRHWGFGAVMVVYVVAIIAATVVMRRAKAVPRGFSSRYTVGLALTFLVYTGYIVIQAGTVDTGMPWGWVVFGAVATMTPALLAARSISRLALR